MELEQNRDYLPYLQQLVRSPCEGGPGPVSADLKEENFGRERHPGFALVKGIIGSIKVCRISVENPFEDPGS